MSLEGAAVSLAATVISALFASLVFRSWSARRKPYQLAWTIGLAMFAVAALTQFLAEAYGWSDGIYRVYYFVSAPLVAVLGVGSAFLVHRRLALAFTLYTLVLGVAFCWVVFSAPVNAASLQEAIPAGNGFPASVRIWSPLFTIPGSLALIGIALVSYWRSRRFFNIPIAAGALVVAGSGALATVGIPALLYLGEAVGIAIMFWGFLLSGQPVTVPGPGTDESPTS